MPQPDKRLLAKWESKGHKYWIELYVEFGTGEAVDYPPVYSYSGDNSGGFLGPVAPEVAMQHAAQQAGFAPSKMPRTVYDGAVAARCCELWQAEQAARAADARARRRSQIEDTLARPVEEGPEWERRREALIQELERLR
jgi:hypothetical protein